jgi:alkyl hydroperoxide reductase subunit F
MAYRKLGKEESQVLENISCQEEMDAVLSNYYLEVFKVTVNYEDMFSTNFYLSDGTANQLTAELNADNILITKLKSLENVSVITNAKTTRIIGNGEKVTSMEYEDRSQNKIKSIKLDGIFIQIGLVPNSGFIKGLVDTNKYGEILVSEKNRTNIDKIYAAGDVTNVPYKQIIIAMGEGAKVGLTAFEDLMIA